jgi:hypothetical protein
MKRTFEWHADLGPLDLVHHHSHHPVRDTIQLVLSALLVAAALASSTGPGAAVAAGAPAPVPVASATPAGP